MKNKIIIFVIIAALLAGGIILLMRRADTGTPDTTTIIPPVTNPAENPPTTPVKVTKPPVTSTPTSTPPKENSYTLAQVAAHSNATSCWTAISASVYDLTAWINQHPGGPDRILAICGTDGTAAFEAQHGGQARPEAELATFRIGAYQK